jgi:DNA mismatch endonuclease (patch repair protein)
MIDRIRPEIRSNNMSKIRAKNTKPELIVRKLVYKLGYRYRVNLAELPGSPDLVFSRKKKIIFIHGCFWHRHFECKYAQTPMSNIEFWEAKFDRNVARDIEVDQKLTRLGWEVLVIWECETRHPTILIPRITAFLS